MEEGLRDTDFIYANHFQVHLTNTEQLLHGQHSTSTSSTSVLSPCTYWSPIEKNLFFHGLSVHSRLRPDLISEDIGTKNVAEVCEYLVLLDTAARNSNSRLQVHSMEAAREMSEEWIEFEESRANELIIHEAEWDNHAIAEERKATLDKARLNIKLKKGEARRDIRDRVGEKMRSDAFKTMKKDSMAKWQKEDYLRELTPLHLRLIDNIIREAGEKSQEIHDGEEISMYIEADQVLQDTTVDQNVVTFQQAVASHQQSLVENVELGTTNLSALNEDEDAVDASTLSPASRRRYQKRLYMRRKRAEAKGLTASSEIGRLKPGRKTSNQRDMEKKKQHATKISNKGSSITCAEDISDSQNMSLSDQLRSSTPDIGDNTLSSESKRIGGITYPYKVKAEMMDLGLDAATLIEEGFQLFRLSRFPKVMKLFSSLDESASAVRNISGESLKILVMHIEYFLKDLIHRIAVLKEQEEELKSRTVVWRRRETQVSPATVQQALVMTNAWQTKAHYFSQLLECSDANTLDASVLEEEESQSLVDSNSSDVLSSPDDFDFEMDSETSAKGSREIFSMPAAASHIGSFVFKLYDDQDIPVQDAENNISPVSTSEDDSSDGSEDDSDLEIQDHDMDIAYERDLWNKYDLDNRGANMTKNTNDLGMRSPGKKSYTQSAEYVLESD